MLHTTVKRFCAAVLEAKASHREIEVRSHGPSEILEISYEARFLPIALAGSVSPPVCCTDDVAD
jgi:hypothetical protein